MTLALPPSDPAVPDYPNALPAFRLARCCRRATSRRSRRIWRTSSRGRKASACSGSSARAPARAIDLNVNRSHKHGFLDTNYPTPISKDVINAAGGRIIRTTGAGRRDAADHAGAERIPAHRGAHQRRADLVSGRSIQPCNTGPRPLMRLALLYATPTPKTG